LEEAVALGEAGEESGERLVGMILGFGWIKMILLYIDIK
jgi:hypothetical protein